MNTMPDDGMNDLVSITKREPPDDELDDTGYLIMPLESLQSSPWPPDEKEES
jgi:hypothetical protein